MDIIAITSSSWQLASTTQQKKWKKALR